jgi:pimeloyl-ACP methyl ester carboxylesterase
MTPSLQPIAFEAPDGLRIAGDAAGPENGLPVVLSHGGGQTRAAWGGCAVLLAAQGFRAYALDLRGHGDSGWSKDGVYGIYRYAADLRAVCAALDRPPLLVGASLGGVASLVAAGEPPEAPVAGLALVDVTPHLKLDGVAGILGFMRSGLQGFASPEEAADAVAAYQPHRPRPRDTSGLQKNLRRREDGRYYWHWDPRTIDRPLDPAEMNRRLEAAAHRLAAPALLLRGEFSELVSHEVGVAFMAEFADGRSLDVPGARHMVAGDRNDLFNRALLDFAEQVRSRAEQGVAAASP